MQENQENVVAIVPPATAPIKLGITNAALKKLEVKYKDVPDAETKTGYQAIVEARRELTPLRTGVEAERKIQVAAAVEHQRRVNSVAKQIKSRIEAIESPLYAAKKAVDDRVEREKQEAEQAEQRRVDSIEQKVDQISQLVNGLLGASLEELENRLKEAESIVITSDVFMEFIEPASIVLSNAKNQLTNAVTIGRDLAKQQKEADENAAAMMEKQRIMDEKFAEQKRVMDEQMAAQQKVIDDQKSDLERQASEIAAEKAIADREKAAQAIADAKAKADKEKAEADAKAAKENAAALKARLPEDAKMRNYVDTLTQVPAPDVKSMEMVAVLRAISVQLSDIREYVLNNTQG